MKKKEQGVLTVEASIILMLLLMFILFLFSFGRAYRAQNLVSHATLQAADAVAMESYLRETALQTDAAEISKLAQFLTESDAISAESLESLRSADLPKIARQKFAAAIASSETNADEKLKNLGVKDGIAGVNFEECKMDLTNDDVIIAVTYNIEMQFPFFGFKEFEVSKAAKAKTFGEILFEVSTKPNVPGWGTTSGDTKVTHGSTVQITAKPNYGYVFDKWEDGSTENPRTVTVTDAQHYVAIFKKDKFGVNISTKINYNRNHAGMSHTSYGSTSGAKTYLYLDEATITATPAANYEFVGWDDNGDGVVDNTNATRKFKVDKTYNFKAIFKPALKTVTVKTNNGSYGTVQVSQGGNSDQAIKVEYGSNVNIVATRKDSVKYLFSKWNDGNTNASRNILVKDNLTFTATFIENTYTVKFFNGNSQVHSTKVIRGSSIDGSKPTIGSSMADSSRISNFSRWVTSNGNTFNSQTKVTSSDVSVSNDMCVYAKCQYTVNLNANGGQVSWTNKVFDMGSKAGLPEPTLSNHTFKGWRDSSGKIYSGNTSYQFDKNISLTAVWECQHRVGKVVKVYQPYCCEVYSGGSITGTLPYREYKCETCGEQWRINDERLRLHHRMNYQANADGGKDCFNSACNTPHADSHEGFCGKYYSSQGQTHVWNGNYHILCSACQKEEQGEVWCYVGGKLVYYNLHKCALHNNPGSVKCPF